jgi:hypothetical protein
MEPTQSALDARQALCQLFLSRVQLREIDRSVFEQLMKRDAPIVATEFTPETLSSMALIGFTINSLQSDLTRFNRRSPGAPGLEIVSSGRRGLTQTFHLKLILEPTHNGAVHMIFLCHSSGDKEKVRRLYAELKQSGFKPWLDEEDLVPGIRWEPAIRKAVKESDIVLVCLSKSSITKEGFVQKEIKIALDIADEKPDDTIYIIPARLEECALPDRLSQWHCVDLFHENGFNKLVTAIRSKSIKA